MPLIDQNALMIHLRDPAYIEFLSAPPTRQTHFLQALHEKHCRWADAALLEVYSSLIWLFETYSTIRGIQPKWLPDKDNDNDDFLVVLFRLKLHTQEGDKAVEREYQYEKYPDSIAQSPAGTEVFDTAIELGEGIGPELWNNVAHSLLCSRETPYTSVAEIEADMHQDIGPFVTEVHAWIMDRTLRLRVPDVAIPKMPRPRV